jgi:hypothetical protein
MKKVCLQFQTITKLTDFLQLIENINCEINRQRLTVICEISEKELEMAIMDFDAQAIGELQ